MYRIWVAIAIVLVALIGAPQLSAADNRGSDQETLRFLEVPDQADFVDLGAAGDSAGDQFLFDNDLRDPRTGTSLGRFAGHCTQLFVNSRCEATLQLARGTIEIAGTLDFAGGQPLNAAVLGGTGRYRDAAGQTTTVLGEQANQLTVYLDR